MISPSGSYGCSAMTAVQEVRAVLWAPVPADSAAVALAAVALAEADSLVVVIPEAVSAEAFPAAVAAAGDNLDRRSLLCP